MHQVLDPFRFVLIAVAGWMNQQQQFAIDYLREENRVLAYLLRRGGRGRRSPLFRTTGLLGNSTGVKFGRPRLDRYASVKRLPASRSAFVMNTWTKAESKRDCARSQRPSSAMAM